MYKCIETVGHDMHTKHFFYVRGNWISYVDNMFFSQYVTKSTIILLKSLTCYVAQC